MTQTGGKRFKIIEKHFHFKENIILSEIFKTSSRNLNWMRMKRDRSRLKRFIKKIKSLFLESLGNLSLILRGLFRSVILWMYMKICIKEFKIKKLRLLNYPNNKVIRISKILKWFFIEEQILHYNCKLLINHFH